MRLAHAAGVDVLALTDHDTTGGWQEALDALPSGLTLVPGAELSCYVDEPGGRISVHLLSYLFDPREPDFATARRELRGSRLTRAERMVGALAADGHPVSWPDVQALAGEGAVGRPHVARALVAAGVLPDVTAAFTDEWIGSSGRYYVDKDELPAAAAIALVRGAGGVVVFAHPGARRRGDTVQDHSIVTLAAAGLAGLEVAHTDHDAAERIRLTALAADLGLFITGGSDFHGSTKPVQLGQERTSPAALEALVAAASGARPFLA